MKKQYSNKALTLVEVCIVVGIFSLFLIAFYMTLEVGLKSWKMGEVAADLQSTSTIVIKRLSNDLENTDSITVEVNDSISPVPYICFDTPLYNGEVQHDPNTDRLLWQGHILYYALSDPDDDKFNTKILYRRYIPHNTVTPYKSDDRFVATFLTDIAPYIDDRELTSAEEDEGQTLRKVCDRLSEVKFNEDCGIVNIELGFQESFRYSKNANVMFATGGDENMGIDKIIVRETIEPRN